jgi:hypothetical protein
MTCYVCNNEIAPKVVKPEKYDPRTLNTFLTVGRDGKWYRRIDLPLYIGQDMYRHTACEPGSARWFKAQDAMPKRKRSKLYDLFALAGTDEGRTIREDAP